MESFSWITAGEMYIEETTWKKIIWLGTCTCTRTGFVQILALNSWKSLENYKAISPVLEKVWSFYFQKCIKCLVSELFFLWSILLIAKTFSHRMIMRSLRTLLCPHCSMVTACLQCIVGKSSSLISYLMTLQSLEK